MEQVAGAGIGTMVILAYVLLLEAMTAAILLLGQFIVLQVRALRGLTVEPKPSSAPVPVASPEPAPQGQTYRLGGDLRW
jgi:hypothetical protein